MEQRVGPGGRADKRPIQLHERKRQASEHSDPQAAGRDDGQQRPTPTRVLKEAPARHTHTDHDAGDHQSREDSHRRRDEPGGNRHQRIPRVQRYRIVELQHHRFSAHERRHRPDSQQAQGRDKRARENTQPRTPHDDYLGEDDRDEAVGTDDVTREEDSMHQAEGQHPPAATANQARGRATRITLDVLLDDLSLDGMPAGNLLGSEGLHGGPALALHRARCHDRHAETEQDREQRVGPAVNEQGPRQVPPLVGAAHRRKRRMPGVRRLREVPKPKGDVCQRNEREHEAPRHVGCRVSKLAFSRERQGVHGVLPRGGVGATKGRGRRVCPGLAPDRVTWVSTSLTSWPAAEALWSCCRLEPRGRYRRSAGRRR